MNHIIHHFTIIRIIIYLIYLLFLLTIFDTPKNHFRVLILIILIPLNPIYFYFINYTAIFTM